MHSKPFWAFAAQFAASFPNFLLQLFVRLVAHFWFAVQFAASSLQLQLFVAAIVAPPGSFLIVVPVYTQHLQQSTPHNP